MEALLLPIACMLGRPMQICTCIYLTTGRARIETGSHAAAAEILQQCYIHAYVLGILYISGLLFKFAYQ